MPPPVGIIIRFNPGTTIEDIEQISARLQSLEVALLEIGLLLSDAMAANFMTAPWPPLKESTIQRKRAAGYPLDPLIRTRAMSGAATGGEWSAGRLGGGSFRATLDVPRYSLFHMPKDVGGFAPTKFMPARDYAFIPDSYVPQAVDILHDWITS